MRPTDRLLPLLLLFLGLLVTGSPVIAEGISVERAGGRFKDSQYLVDADITYDLGDSAIEALRHGISLRFDVTIEIRRERDWIWDQTSRALVIGYELEYVPLTDSYLVTRLDTGDREQIGDLDDALKYLGNLRDIPVSSDEDLDPDTAYRGFIMSRLRISTLPLPLQPLAYVSPKWKLSSHWYEWTVR